MTPREIAPHALRARLDAGEPTLLVDVREPWEHQQAALRGAVLVPLGQLAARAHEIDPADGTLVVTYCHHGVRSLSAAAVLAAAGLDDVVSLRGGIDAWSTTVDPTVPRY